jgi:sirohydrochlorin ferrochelatase
MGGFFFWRKPMNEHMNPPVNPPSATDERMVHLPRDDFDALLDRAAELGAQRGAERVLAHLGLENGHAARDVRELRDLLSAWRDARKTAWQTFIKVLTTGLLAALLVGVGIKLKLFGAAP